MSTNSRAIQRFFLIVLMSFCSGLLNGQSIYPDNDSTYKKYDERFLSNGMKHIVDSLSKTRDGWVFYTFDGFQDFGDEKLEYLLWKENDNKSHLVKQSTVHEKVKRNDFTFSNVVLFDFLKEHARTINDEIIFPFIFKTNINGHDAYFELGFSHMQNFILQVQFNGTEFLKEYPIYGIYDTYVGETNLNYTVNSSLKMVQLIKILEDIIKIGRK